jgi:serine/threonine protein kinase
MQKRNIFRKNYLEDSLLDDATMVLKRIEMINGFEYEKYPALAKTYIFKKDNVVYYEQEKFSIIKNRSSFVKEDFYPIADALNYFESIGFIHGDINRKNIIYTTDGFKIIDYEPSLLQLKDNKEQLMVTLPYVLEDELLRKVLTVNTDKIGFYYFLLRINNKMPSIKVVRLMKKLSYNTKILNQIKKLNFKEIVENYKNIR